MGLSFNKKYLPCSHKISFLPPTHLINFQPSLSHYHPFPHTKFKALSLKRLSLSQQLSPATVSTPSSFATASLLPSRSPMPPPPPSDSTVLLPPPLPPLYCYNTKKKKKKKKVKSSQWFDFSQHESKVKSP